MTFRINEIGPGHTWSSADPEPESDAKLPVAYLIHQEKLYYATQKQIDHAPHSAVTRLIQGIYQLDPTQARKILRNRIYTNLTRPTVMCHAMVKVAAKSLTCDVPFERPELLRKIPLGGWILVPEWMPPPRLPQIAEEELAAESDADFMELAIRLAGSAKRSANRFESDRAVGSVLVAPNPSSGKNEILSVGINTNASNRTLHSEVNLVQSFFQKTGAQIPKHARIYISLKPCRMCAGMIWHCASEPSTLKIFYAEDDPGPLAKNTIFSPDSFDRKIFSPEIAGSLFLNNIN